MTTSVKQSDLRKYLAEKGLVDGLPMVPGVKGDPTAKEFLDHWVPIIESYLSNAQNADTEKAFIRGKLSALNTIRRSKWTGMGFEATRRLDREIAKLIKMLDKMENL